MSDNKGIETFQTQGITVANKALETSGQLTEVSNMLLDQMRLLRDGKTDVATCSAMGDLSKQIIEVHRTNIAAAALVIKTIQS